MDALRGLDGTVKSGLQSIPGGNSVGKMFGFGDPPVWYAHHHTLKRTRAMESAVGCCDSASVAVTTVRVRNGC